MQVEDEHTSDASFSTAVKQVIVIAKPSGAQSMRKEIWGGVDMDHDMKYYLNFRAMRL
jgi:hypothetical protein